MRRRLALLRQCLEAHAGHHALPLVSVARALPGSQQVGVRLRIGPRTLGLLRRQLGGRRRLRAAVTIIAAGPTGRRTVLSKTYLLHR